MKILFINKFLYPKGGAELVFLETASLVEKHDHDVVFFSMRHSQNISSQYEKYFVTNIDFENHSIKNIIKTTCRIFYSFEARTKIEELIQKENPDIAHLHNVYHQISPSIIHSLRKYKIPIVMTLHDYKVICASYSMLAGKEVCEACKNGRYYKCLIKKCVKDSRAKSFLNTIEMYLHHSLLNIYNLVDIFISPSEFLKNKVQEMGFRGEIVYLPNFVETKDFKPKHGWDGKYVVYLGRLSKEKGVSTLIAAMKSIPEVNLKIIGAGPLKDHLISTVQSQGISNVEFAGYKTGDGLKNIVRDSMFVVIPSEWYENNPRSVIEAFALGKPVIGAGIGGIPELVRDGETGYIYAAKDVKDLSGKIKYLFDNPELIKKMGQNARCFVEEKLNAEKHYEGLMDVYRNAIEKNKKTYA